MQDSLFQIEAYFSTCMWFLAVLVIFIAVIFAKVKSMHKDMERMKQELDNVSVRSLRLVLIDENVRKLESAVNWFLESKGLKIERTQLPTSHEWNVVPIQNTHEIDDWWKHIQVHREEIVYALYKATKNALDDHDKDKNKKGKKK